MTTLRETYYARALGVEPLLRTLHLEVRKLRYTRRFGDFCRNAVWFGRFKPLIVMLVGFQRGQSTSLPVAKWYWYEGPDAVSLNDLGPPGAITRHDDPVTEEWMRGVTAYDAVYAQMFSLLPPCRGCGCDE